MNGYLPPAGIDDFSRSAAADDLRKGWHKEITDMLARARSLATNPLASPLFYDHLADTSGVPDSQPQGIPWNGFPKRLAVWFDQGGPQQQEEARNRAAEVLLRQPVFGLFRESGEPLEVPFRVQDEYCEWHVQHNGEKIERISFTCEPPEYWEFLAKKDFNLVHQLYKELLHNDEIPAEDLKWQFDVFSRNNRLRFKKGDYNPHNVWNTERGAVHLTHPANSLEAECILASDGTLGWPVTPDAQGKIDEIKLMCCAGRGGINRSSDPLILKGVFDFARQGLSVALANPIGLYMAPFSLGGLLDPDENPIGADCLRFVRQSADGSRILRAEVAVPAGSSFTLDECTLDGSPLRFGGQIARLITMRLFGVAKKIPSRNVRKVSTCPVFCCTHPKHKQFRGTFSSREFTSCNEVTDRDWNAEAFDIPQLPVDGPAPAGFDAVIMEAEAEAPRPSPGPLTPVGRRVIAADDQPSIEFEENSR